MAHPDFTDVISRDQNEDIDDNFIFQKTCSSEHNADFLDQAGCVQIPSIEEETQKFKDMKPFDIYLDYCQQFSENNLKKERVSIPEYLFQAADFDEGNQSLSSDVRSICKSLLQNGAAITSEFTKMFPRIVFQGQRQQTIVQTWQKLKVKSEDAERVFHLKTLRIFDLSLKMQKQIITEQADGAFEVYRLNVSSTASFQFAIYYFKRLFIGQKSCLQLYKYDLLASQEALVAGYKIEEPEGIQYNSIFAERFGHEKAPVYKTEKEFLVSQFVLLQNYIKGRDQHVFAIYSLADLAKPIDLGLQKDEEPKKSKQIQHLLYSECCQGEGGIVFVVLEMLVSKMIAFNPQTKKSKKPIVSKYFTADLFMRAINLNLHIRKIDLVLYDESDALYTKEQYFFVDSKNEIRMVFPTYPNKIEHFKVLENIKEQANIPSLNYMKYKMIQCVYYQLTHCIETDEDQSAVCGSCSLYIPFKKIKALRMILNDETISTHMITFCKDSDDSILYVYDPKSTELDLIQLCQSNSEECLMHTTQNIKEQFSEGLINQFAQLSYLRQSKRSQRSILSSRQTPHLNMLVNSLQSTIKSMCDEHQHEECIHYSFEKPTWSKIRKQIITKIKSLEEEKGDSTPTQIEPENQSTLNRPEEVKHNEIVVQNLEGSSTKIMLTERSKTAYGLKSLIYQKTEMHYFFLLMAFDEDDPDYDKSYIFLTVSMKEMLHVLSRCRPLVLPNDKVQLLRSATHLQDVPLEKVLSGECNKPEFLKDQTRKDMKLSFQKLRNEKQVQNFVVLVYQEYQDITHNQMLVYDIYQKKLVGHTSLQTEQRLAQYLFEDDQGFNCFNICRVSDIVEEKPKRKGKGYPKAFKDQKTKFQLFILFKENIGLIMVNEFIINHSAQSVRIYFIGMKMIIISRKCIQVSDWNDVKNSKAIPFYDEQGCTKGCQFVYKHNQKDLVFLNLLDQDKNNQYSYQSQNVSLGQKKFYLNEDDPSLFLWVLSVQLRKELVKLTMQGLFEYPEIQSILISAIASLLVLKIPTIESMVVQDFESVKTQEFFINQENLMGLNFCDIFLSDPDSIKLALKQKKKHIQQINGTLVDQLVAGDKVRKSIFQKVGFYPHNMIVHKDFNYLSTIERGLTQNSIISVKLLLDRIITVINTQEYTPFIMLDFLHILQNKRININGFYTKSHLEKHTETYDPKRQELGFCNMEIDLKHSKLPVFSSHQVEYIKLKGFKDYMNFENEIIDVLIANGEKQHSVNKNIEVRHYYIDFQQLIIGSKLRSRHQLAKKKLKFDDLFYATLMVDKDDDFYMQTTIQQIIDFQFKKTQAFIKVLFLLYILFFITPFILCLGNYDEHKIELNMNVALGCQVFFFIIELIQLKDQGLSYFIGWNITDFSQFLVFVLIYVIESPVSISFKDEATKYIAHIRFLMVVLTFVKILFFVRIFKDYGFLVQMLIQTFIDLIPFFGSFVIMLVFFSISLATLRMEVDDEINDVQGPGFNYFGKVLLQVYMAAIGEISLPAYDSILQQPSDFNQQSNIALIWLVWFSNTFVMIIILLNFLIAVISQTYDRIISQKAIYTYSHKSDLNQETFHLLSKFVNLQEYKVMAFTQGIEFNPNEYDEIDELKDQFDEMKNLIQIKHQSLCRHVKSQFKEIDGLKKDLKLLKSNQQELAAQMKSGFADILKVIKK